MSRTIHLPKRGSARGRFCRRSVRFKVRQLGFGLPVRWVAEQIWRWASGYGLTPGQASAAADYARRYAMRRERAAPRSWAGWAKHGAPGIGQRPNLDPRGGARG